MAEDRWVYRSDGYYWIIKDKDRSYLQIAYYQQGRFYIAGSTSHFFPCELLKIGPRLRPPYSDIYYDITSVGPRISLPKDLGEQDGGG